jgi:hypothetical protein
LAGKGKKSGAVQLPDDGDAHAELGVVNAQPGRMESPRYQALLAAVEAGYVSPFDVYFCELIDKISGSAIPASALNEEDEDEEDEEFGETRDDERSGTRYNVGTLSNPHARFHLTIFWPLTRSTLGFMSSSQSA